MKLSKQDAALLVTLYETEEYSALMRFMEARMMDLAKGALQAVDYQTLCRQQGRVSELEWLIEEIYKLYKKGNK